MNILILGATGMLGYSLYSNLSEYKSFNVFGSVRSVENRERFFLESNANIIPNIDVTDYSSIEVAITQSQADVVINCIGLIKQHKVSNDHVAAIKINALLPHQLAALCDKHNAKLIHFSTDCVFDGKKGLYQESDLPDATDLYGKSKCLGEVGYHPHLTLRTSIIGHELNSSVSLIDWFLKQEEEVNGFSKAVFSGLPTCYIAKLLAEKILSNPELTGLYHLSAEPVDKYTLISMVAEIYGKSIAINEYADFVIDRSLDSSRLRDEIEFKPPTWKELIQLMHKDYIKRYTV